MQVKLSEIRIDGGTQQRPINDEWIDHLVEHLDSLPPVLLFTDGKDRWLADGFHRYHAFARAKKTTIEATVKKGTQQDAKEYSWGCNNEHGLPRTMADKRNCVLAALADKKWCQETSRKIATVCNVSHTFVDKIRNSQSAKSGNVATFPTLRNTWSNAAKEAQASQQQEDTKDSEPKETEESATANNVRVVNQPVDKLGNAITNTEILDIWNRSNELATLAQKISDIKCRVMKAVEGHEEAFAYIVGSSIKADLVNVYQAFMHAIPYCLCPYGDCRELKTCKLCGGRGWITQDIYRMVPEEMKV